MAFHIIRHAFLMIFSNLGQALRVSIGPYLLLIAAVAGTFLVLGFPSLSQIDPTTGAIDPDAVAAINPLGLVVAPFMIAFGLFVFGWVAVSWHRFILLEEYAGFLPAVSGRPIWPYVGRSFLYGLLLTLVAIPLVLVFGMFGPFLLVIPGAILTFLWFRIGLALPSIAVGKPISMGQAWSASSGMSGTILGVAFLLMLINGAASIVVDQIAPIAGIIAFVLELVLQWVTLMLGVSILTTLYGHLIENRPLID